MQRNLTLLVMLSLVVFSAAWADSRKGCLDEYYVNCDPEGGMFRIEANNCTPLQRLKPSGNVVKKYSTDLHLKGPGYRKIEKASCTLNGKTITASWVAKPITGNLKGCGRSGKVPVLSITYDGREVINNMPLAACTPNRKTKEGIPVDFDYVGIVQDEPQGPVKLRVQYDYDTRWSVEKAAPEVLISSETQPFSGFHLYPSPAWEVSRSDIKK